MAAYISVPRDLTKVKSKVAFNLTKRQLVCFGTAALIGAVSYTHLTPLPVLCALPGALRTSSAMGSYAPQTPCAL